MEELKLAITEFFNPMLEFFKPILEFFTMENILWIVGFILAYLILIRLYRIGLHIWSKRNFKKYARRINIKLGNSSKDIIYKIVKEYNKFYVYKYKLNIAENKSPMDILKKIFAPHPVIILREEYLIIDIVSLKSKSEYELANMKISDFESLFEKQAIEEKKKNKIISDINQEFNDNNRAKKNKTYVLFDYLLLR